MILLCCCDLQVNAKNALMEKELEKMRQEIEALNTQLREHERKPTHPSLIRVFMTNSNQYLTNDEHSPFRAI